MHVELPKSETQRNVESIKYAIDRKTSEVEKAGRQLDELRAELRGLQAALKAINPQKDD